MSIGEKKVVGGAAPRYKRLEEHRRCRGMTIGIRADSGLKRLDEKLIPTLTVGIRVVDLCIEAATQLHRSEVGIRAKVARDEDEMVKPDRAGLLMIGEADKVMEKSWMNSLGFVDLMVHGKTIQALVDTGATHNFMTT